MLITNIWGIVFSFCIPMAISVVCCYIEGIEDGKKKILKNRRIK